MKIAIEGMDGVGKSTVAKAIAKNLEFTYIEKPLTCFFDEADDKSYPEFAKVVNRIYDTDDPVIKAWFFGLGNLYSFRNFKDRDLVIDRHFASNYFWNGNNESDIIFKTMIDLIGVPDMTILLYASPETRLKRLNDRNPNDYDLTDKEKHVLGYDKMVGFLNKFNIPFTLVDTENKNIEQVINEVYLIIEKLKRENKKETRKQLNLGGFELSI